MRDNSVKKIRLKIDSEFEVADLDLSALLELTKNGASVDAIHFSTSEERTAHKGLDGSIFTIFLNEQSLSIISKNNAPMMAIEYEGELTKEILDIATVLLKLHYYYRSIKMDDALLNKIFETLNENNVKYANNSNNVKDAKKELIKLVKLVQDKKVEEVRILPSGNILTAPQEVQTEEEWFGNAIIYDKAEKLPPRKIQNYLLYKNEIISTDQEEQE